MGPIDVIVSLNCDFPSERDFNLVCCTMTESDEVKSGQDGGQCSKMFFNKLNETLLFVMLLESL